MRYLFSYFALFFLMFVAHAQNVAIFQLKDDTQKVMCYTGSPLNNSVVAFKNTSTCSGTCLYLWDFGDNSPQIVKADKSEQTHNFNTDGEFTIRLGVLNVASIHDSIANKLISATYISEINDSVDIDVHYTGSNFSEQQVVVRIPKAEYAKKTLPEPITVYSPVVDASTNFLYRVEDPSTQEHVVAIQSFVHILTVDTSNFKPHAPDMWKYYWQVYSTEESGEPKKLISEFVIDSLEYRYTFPQESFNPGYYVKLKIALDSSKFEDQSMIPYYNLEGCVASQSQIIPVTDYFFSDSSRKEENPLDRSARIPNIFTPGGNDENEVFFFNTNGVDVFSIWIYNSWGTIVYKQEANTISWTGKDNSGQDCPSGTYYYVINSNNRDDRHEKSGFIHLFRQN